MKEYLLHLANEKLKDINNNIEYVKNTLKKDPNSLASYVDYVNNMKTCKIRRESLNHEKKVLEDMNVTLRR
jgi:hypothetical protein